MSTLAAQPDALLASQAHEKRLVAGTSVVAAVFLTGLKLVVGLSTGSLGILAEAAHSALDLAAAVITLLAVRVSDRPADESHPYGHGKIENLSALAETALLLLTCGWIVYEALKRLLVRSVDVDPSLWAFATMAISIVIDVSRSRALARVARKYQSQALEADALHFSTDVWSSAVVIGGLALVKLGEWTGYKAVLLRADAVAALFVALIVVHVSIKLGRRTVDALLDRAPAGLATDLTAAVRAVPGVRDVSRVRVRGSGNDVFVDVSIAIARQLSFEQSYAITDLVSASVRRVAPRADVVVHTVPQAAKAGVLETIQAVAARGQHAVHNITTHVTKRGIWIDLDLEVDPQLSFAQAHAVATELEDRLREAFAPAANEAAPGPPVADINIHIEPQSQELLVGRELPRRTATRYAARLATLGQEVPHVRGCSDVDVQELDQQVYLAFHLQVDAGLTIPQVHALTEEMENRLRREFPELGRVIIHAEPA
jgi:cation diffusion facilitator family transporter